MARLRALATAFLGRQSPDLTRGPYLFARKVWRLHHRAFTTGLSREGDPRHGGHCHGRPTGRERDARPHPHRHHHRAPVLRLGVAGWQAWNELLAGTTWSSSLIIYAAHRRSASPSASTGFSPTAASRPAAPSAAARRARLGRDRGPGHLLGRRPPQAPRVLRRGGRPAQPARRPRRRVARAAARPAARARRLAVHPHAARLEGALRARPARRPGRALRRPHVPALGRRRPRASRSSSASRSAARSTPG